MYGKLLILSLMFVLVLSSQAYALEKIISSGYDFSLLESYSDYPKVILDHTERPRIYTPTSIVEYHLPIMFKKTTLFDERFYKDDIAFYYKELIGSGMDSVKVQYLVNESYQERGDWVCTKWSEEERTNPNTGKNETQEFCADGYREYHDAWRMVWQDYPDYIDIKSTSLDMFTDYSKYQIIDFIGYKKAGEKLEADVVPTLKAIELDKYAWWNASYDYRFQVNISSTQILDKHAMVNFTLDTASLISAGKMRSDCMDLRIVNSSDDGLVPYDWEGYGNSVYGCNQAETIIWLTPYVLADNSTNVWFYYGSDAETTFGNSTDGYVLLDYEAVFHFGEGTGTTLYNAVDGVSATITGATWFDQIDDGLWDSVGSGLSFDGTNDEVCFGDYYDLTDDFTVEIWFTKPEEVSGNTQVPVGKQGATANAWWILLGRSGESHQLLFHRNAEDDWTTAGLQDYTHWYHYAGLYYDPSNVLIHYLNGTKDSQDTASADPVDNGDSFCIGHENQWNTFYKGNITEIRISESYIGTNATVLNYDIMRYADQLITIGSEEDNGLSDWGSPVYYGNTTSSPANYHPSVNTEMAVYWNTTTLPYNYSEICHNASGSWVCAEATRLETNASYAQIVSPATTWTWYGWANDSVNGDVESIPNMTVIVAQNSSTTCSQSFSGNPINYGTSLTASCSCTQPEGITNMFRDTTNVTGEGAIVLGAGSYAYVCNVTSVQNYTVETDSDTLVVNKADATFDWWINGVLDSNDSSYGTGTNISFNATVTTPQCVKETCFNVYVRNSTESFRGITDWNVGWVGDITLLGYNNTLEVDDYYFFLNTTEEANYSASEELWHFTITGAGTLEIRVYDEDSNASLTFNITMRNDSFSFTDYDKTTFSSNATNTPYGSVSIDYWASGYPQRSYYTTFTNSTNDSINLYLLAANNTGQYVSFYMKTYLLQPITNGKVYAAALSGLNYTDVAQRETDDAGVATIFLDYTTQYRIVAEASGYSNRTLYITPTLTGYEIIMGNLTNVNYTNVFEDLVYTTYPYAVTLLNQSTSFHFNMSSSNSSLAYQGVNYSYPNGTVVYSNNTTTTSGVNIINTIDLTTYQNTTLNAYYFFKKDNYDLFWIKREFRIASSVNETYSNMTAQGLADRIDEMGVSADAFAFFTIIIVIFIGGMAVGAIGEKGGFLGLTVLAIMTFWGSSIYGDAYLLGWLVFMFTSVALVAWYYVRSVF